jgi:hypothetical protein
VTLSRTKYVNLLRAQKGYHEGRDANGNWNNHQKFSLQTAGLEWSDYQAWCHTFCSWGADELGERGALPITASCLTGVQWFKSRGRFTEYPVLGGLFYMGTYGGDHVGVVYAYDADYIYTIEGNTNPGGSYQGDGVYERRRPRRGAGSPYGYGIPYYSEKTVSADPAWGGIRSAEVPVLQEEDDDMALSQDDINKIAQAVWNHTVTNAETGKPLYTGAAIAWLDKVSNTQTDILKREIAALKADIAALSAKVGE